MWPLSCLLKVAFDTNRENANVLVMVNSGLNEARVDNFFVFAERTVANNTDLECANKLVHKFRHLRNSS